MQPNEIKALEFKLWKKYIADLKSGELTEDAAHNYGYFIIEQMVKMYPNWSIMIESGTHITLAGLQQLWQQLCGDPPKTGGIEDSYKIMQLRGSHFFEFADLVAKTQHQLDMQNISDKCEAWDKLEEVVDEVENHEVKDIMLKVMSAVKGQQQDDQLARNSGFKTGE